MGKQKSKKPDNIMQTLRDEKSNDKEQPDEDNLDEDVESQEPTGLDTDAVFFVSDEDEGEDEEDKTDEDEGSTELDVIRSYLHEISQTSLLTFAEGISMREEIDKWLKLLRDKEREVISLRFGLEGQEAMTLEEIGNRPEFGLTRERIRQIESSALSKLRSIIAKRSIKKDEML